MAEPDHTVLARPSGPHFAPITHLSGDPPALLAKGEKTQLGIHSTITEIEEINRVVQHLHGDNEDDQTVFGRLVSCHFLDRCADQRRRHPHG